MKKKDPKEKNKLLGFGELLSTLININRRALIIIYLSIPFAFSLRFFGITIPDKFLVVMFIFAASTSIYYYLVNNWVKTRADMENISLLHFLADLTLYTIIIYYNGGLGTVMVFIYSFIIVEANIVLPRKKSFLVILFAICVYSAVLLLEFSNILPHQDFFIKGELVSHLNSQFVLFNIFMVGFAGFNYLGFITSNFSSIYRRISNTLIREREELIKAQSELKESKDMLEIRVKARTKELEELTLNLEDQVRNRTKELTEKLEELEKFRKLTVGREMKMIELKNEIDELRERHKKSK